MGVVYVAEDTLLGRRVAVKLLTIPPAPGNSQFRTRFLREARAASILNHPHIATIYDYGETPDQVPFIVMELVDGQNLAERLQQGSLSLERSLEIVQEVAEALGEAHRHGLIHRDIKPSNIAINQRGDVKVLDFGLAKQLRAEDPALSVSATDTRAGVIIGTPSYLSPEQVLGSRVDVRSDLFSLGLLLYECLTGRPAFAGINVMEICSQIIRDDPSPPSTHNPLVTPALDRITLKALAKKADERYQTADQFVADLTTTLSSLPEVLQPRQTPRLRKIAAQLTRARLFAGALILLLIFAFMFLMMRSSLWRRINRHEPSTAARQWYQAGVDALRDGNSFKASKLLEQSVQADERFLLAHARLAEAWSELDYEDRATNAMLRVTEQAPDSADLAPVDALYIQAIASTIRHNYHGAVQSYEELVRQLPESEKTYALYDLGRAYEKKGDVSRAVETQEQITRRDVRYAAAFMRLGILYSRRQERQKADAALDNAQLLYEAQSNYDGLIEVSYQRGYLLNVQGKLDEARKRLQSALDLAAATANRTQQIKALLELSSICYSAGALNEAQRYANEGIQLARSEQLENLTTSGLVDIGNTFFLKGESAEAEKYFNQALQIARANKGSRGAARASLSLGSLYVQQGRGRDALNYIEPALAFYRQHNFRTETSQALLLSGYANVQLGNYEAGYEAFREQLKLVEEVSDVPQMAQTHNVIGLLLTHREQYTQALEHFDESASLSKAQGIELNAGYDIVGRGNVLWQLGRYPEARDALAQASQVVSNIEGGNQHLLAWIHLSKARLSLSRLNHPEAISESRKALALAGAHDQDLFVQSSITTCLAQTRSGTSGAGLLSCQRAFEKAAQARDPRLISSSQLALAEAQLQKGDTPAALATALQAQESFARSRQQHSEWQALLLLARASKQLNAEAKAREYAAHATGLFSRLEALWGAEAYRSYLQRPDVQLFRKQLDDILNRKQ